MKYSSVRVPGFFQAFGGMVELENSQKDVYTWLHGSIHTSKASHFKKHRFPVPKYAHTRNVAKWKGYRFGRFERSQNRAPREEYLASKFLQRCHVLPFFTAKTNSWRCTWKGTPISHLWKGASSRAAFRCTQFQEKEFTWAWRQGVTPSIAAFKNMVFSVFLVVHKEKDTHLMNPGFNQAPTRSSHKQYGCGSKWVTRKFPYGWNTHPGLVTPILNPPWANMIEWTDLLNTAPGLEDEATKKFLGKSEEHKSKAEDCSTRTMARPD